MAIDNTVSITIDELKTIIHGLRMATLSFVEEGAIDEIEAMIKALPLPEEIDKLQATPVVIKNLQNDVGNIMRLIEIYSKRDIEFKTRYKSRTGLPPRYKVLDWRSKMDKAALTRGFVKISSCLDDIGYGDVSNEFIKIAKINLSNQNVKKDFVLAMSHAVEKIGFKDDAEKLYKLAQTYDASMSDIVGGLQQIDNQILVVLRNLATKYNELKNVPTAKNAIGLMNNLWNQMVDFQSNIKQQVEVAQKMQPEVGQGVEESVPTSIFDAATQKVLPIQWTEVDAQGEQTAFVEKGGKKYVVERTSSGKLIANKELQEEVQQPAQVPQPAQTEQHDQQAQQDVSITSTPPMSQKKQLREQASLLLQQANDAKLDQLMSSFQMQSLPNMSKIDKIEAILRSVGAKSIIKSLQSTPSDQVEQQVAASRHFNLMMHKKAQKI